MNCVRGLKILEGFRSGSLPLGSQHHCYLIEVSISHLCFTSSSVFFGGGGDWTLRSWDLTLAVLRPQVKLSILDLSAMLAGLHQAESTAPTS